MEAPCLQDQGRDLIPERDPKGSARDSPVRPCRTRPKPGAATDTPAKSLIRMFGPRGNPQARNLFAVIYYLQKQARLSDRCAVRGKNLFSICSPS